MISSGHCVGFLALLITVVGCVPILGAYNPPEFERYRFFINRDMMNPETHQLIASWIGSQLRRNDLRIDETPIIANYRLGLPGKRNSEVTNAIIGSEETQKMYRDGKK